MKTKLIAGLTALSILSFPVSAMAAKVPAQTPVCPVAGCQITGAHTHNKNGYTCSVSGCKINGTHSHANGHANHSSTEHSQGSGRTGNSFRGAHH